MSEERVGGQSISGERLARAQARVSADALKHHELEAAKMTEDIISWLQEVWADRAFTREQAVFSIALATINLRETYPDGKDAFDAVAAEARHYYDLHKDE